MPAQNMFAQKLKELRLKQKGLTQARLAEYLGVSQQSVGLWENGGNMPSHKRVEAIADFFHVTTDYLLGRDAPRPGAGVDAAGLSEDALTIAAAYDRADNHTQHIVSVTLLPFVPAEKAASAAIASTASASDTAARIGRKILAASPDAQAAVSQIIEEDVTENRRKAAS